MSHASEMIVRLSGQDRNGVDMISITVGYVLDVDGVDASQVDQAFRRVCEKWRLLAGRIEWSKKHGVWTVRTPLVEPLPADYKTHGFTSSTSTSPLGVPIPNLTPSSAEFLPSQPSSAAFRDPTVPKTTSAMASNKHPLVSLHVSTFSDCTTVGITFPHSVFDGTGMGSVISALDCELNRRPWTPPAFQEENILEVELLKEIVVPEGTTIPEPNRDFVPFSIFNLARFLAALVYERLWHKDTMGGIFLGEEAQQKLVDEVKGQVKRETGGREFVSTGDVLYAWFLKAAYLDEPTSPNLIHPCCLFSTRSILTSTTSNPSFHTYTHNAAQAFYPSSLTIPTLLTTPLSTLALLHRRSLNSSRNISFIRKTAQAGIEAGGNMLPRREMGKDHWIFTNQCVAKLTEIEFKKGGKIRAFWLWDLPFTPDHAVPINQLNGGFVLHGLLRPSRWKSIVEELERLKGNGERRVL